MRLKTEQEIADELAQAHTVVEVGARYVHYKDAVKQYVVTGLGILEDTNDVAVIYEAQYSEHFTFIRRLSSWLEEVHQEGQTVKRFTMVESAND
jgi:hypothetical protein